MAYSAKKKKKKDFADVFWCENLFLLLKQLAEDFKCETFENFTFHQFLVFPSAVLTVS